MSFFKLTVVLIAVSIALTISFIGLVEITRIHNSFVNGCLVITPANNNMASTISNLELVKDKDEYSLNDNITINVNFSLNGDVRNAFNEKNWAIAWDKNDNQFKLKYGIKLVSSGLRKHDIVSPINSYRKASIFWTRNPKLVNPMKERKIWVQVAKNFEPYIKLTVEDTQKELFDFNEPIIINASDLGIGNHKIGAEVFVSWNKHEYVEAGQEKTRAEEIEVKIN